MSVSVTFTRGPAGWIVESPAHGWSGAYASLAAVDFRDTADPLRYVPAVARVLQDDGFTVGGGHVTVDGDLPIGRGFSSSAALSVATVRALAPELPDLDTARVAYRAEHDLVGVACGPMDQLACAIGRPVLIDWNRPDEPQIITPGKPVHLVVGAFAEPRDTLLILATLNAHHAGHGDPDDVAAVRAAISAWARLAPLAAQALTHGDARRLATTMNQAQHTYEQLLGARLPALAAPRLALAVRALRHHGAYGAKFSGAGGDGSVVGVAPDEDAARGLSKVLRKMGLSAWEATIHA